MRYAARIHNRSRITNSICFFILALFASAGISRAQDSLFSGSQYLPAQQSASPSAPAPVPTVSDAASKTDASGLRQPRHQDYSGSVHGRDTKHSDNNGFSITECLFCNDFKPGAGTRSNHFSNHFSNPAGDQDDLDSLFQGPSGFNSDRSLGSGGMGVGRVNAGSMGAGMYGAHRTSSGDLKVDQLPRSDLGMYFKSSLGKFGGAYRDSLLGTKSNNLGGGMGQGSPRATFNSSSFANGIFNFSAAGTLGSGSMAGSTHGGFSANSMSGNRFGGQFGPGSDKRPATSVSLHLSF
jgi:hypothetical protein